MSFPLVVLSQKGGKGGFASSDISCYSYVHFNCRFVGVKVVIILHIGGITLKYFVRKNDVLFQAKGSKIEVVYVDKDYENVLPATLYFILRANEKVNPKYLQWLLKTELLLLYFEKKYKTMSAVRAVNKTDIVELDIDLPEREVQDRMVEIINNFETEEESTMEYLQLKKKYIEEKILAENKVIINEE